MSQTTRKFVNGIFTKKVWQDPDDVDNSLFSIGIRVDEVIKYLEQQTPDEKGFINLTMGSQKEDRKKLSIWEPTPQSASRSGGTNYKKSASSPPKPKKAAAPADDTDDLPF